MHWLVSESPHHRGPPQVSYGGDLLDRQLAKDGQHEVLQQAVLENIHGSRLEAFRKRATAKHMLHRRPHLET